MRRGAPARVPFSSPRLMHLCSISPPYSIQPHILISFRPWRLHSRRRGRHRSSVLHQAQQVALQHHDGRLPDSRAVERGLFVEHNELAVRSGHNEKRTFSLIVGSKFLFSEKLTATTPSLRCSVLIWYALLGTYQP